MKPTKQSLGGIARAAKLNDADRSRIARDAAKARWSKYYIDKQADEAQTEGANK